MGSQRRRKAGRPDAGLRAQGRSIAVAARGLTRNGLASLALLFVLGACGPHGQDVWQAKIYNASGVLESRPNCTPAIWQPKVRRQTLKQVDRGVTVSAETYTMSDGAKVFYAENHFSNDRTTAEIYTGDAASCQRLYPVLFKFASERLQRANNPRNFEKSP
jgi:hypothetical protein